MNFTIHNAKQGTEEWLQARAGCVTGSRASDVLAKIKTGEAAARRDYRIQLLAERLSGKPQEDGFISKEMQWGNEQEPLARMAYEAATGVIVRETGFIRHNKLPVGCSVDGDIENFTGLVEFKCPKTATHIGWLVDGCLPSKHAPQITHNLWVTGAKWCDFVSFDPRLPEHLQLFMVRVERDSLDLAGYENEVLKFLAELAALEDKLKTIELGKAA